MLAAGGVATVGHFGRRWDKYVERLWDHRQTQALSLAESVSKPGRSDRSAAPGAKLAGGTWEVGTRRTEAHGQQAQREPGCGTELIPAAEGSPWAACRDQLHGAHVCGTFGASDGAGASC